MIDHPKLARLKAKLRVPKYVAVGILETMWHFCGRYTPSGDIGRYSDAEIEAWLEWGGEEGLLVAALVDARFLDRCETHRLVVHDWSQHADDATRLSLKRTGKGFCVTTVSGQCRDSVATTSGLPEPVPEPVPEPEPEPEPEPDKKLVKATREKKDVPSSLEEVRGYCRDKGFTELEAEAFFDHFTANGWKTGRAPGIPMRDWRAAMNGWHRRQAEFKTASPLPASQRVRTREELEAAR